MKKRNRDGYVIVEAAVLLPMASVILLLLVYLCSYLYQSCYLMQSAYLAAFRASREERGREAAAQEQLDELMEREVLTFEAEERRVDASALAVTVQLRRGTPFARLGDFVSPLEAEQRALVRDPVAFIRGMQALREWRANSEIGGVPDE